MSDLFFSKISTLPEAQRVDDMIARKSNSPRLRNLGEVERARDFLRTNLCGSYLFSRYTVPSFGSAVLSSLHHLPPLDDTRGILVKRLIDSVVGEICNNNIFDRPGECHAHYRDMREAYAAAGNAMTIVERFESQVDTFGLEAAMNSNPVLWSEGTKRYGQQLVALCDEPLAIFLLMAVTEQMTPHIYRRALEYLPYSPELRLFRHFLERHVELDRDDHGPAAFQWFALASGMKHATERRLKQAYHKVLQLHGAA